MNPIEQGIGPINPFFMWYTVSRVGIWCTDQDFEVVSPSGCVADGTNIRLALEVPPKNSRVVKKARYQLSILHLMTKTCFFLYVTACIS